MNLKELHIQHFRGFLDLSVRPKGHVVVMGEPGSGRSDLIEALARILDAETRRTRITTELDFHNRETTTPIQITLVLAGLGPDLLQHFFKYLELWDKVEDRLLVENETPDAVDQDRYEWVLRLEYRARWLLDEERCEEFVYYPKESDPAANFFIHTRRADIEELGFGWLRWSGGRLFDLGPRSTFRRVIERSTGDDFADAVTQYVQAVTQAAGQFTGSAQVKAALEDVIAPLRDLIGLTSTDLSQVFQFAPEGGSPTGLLRSLGPSIDTGDGAGSIPAWRRGSTMASLFRIAEALALASAGARILAIDDLGDGLDAASAAHLASVMRRSAGQAWITTRVPSVAEVFDPQEVVRLGREQSGARFIRQGRQPTTKAEAVASKHWHRNLLPALSYRSVVVVEGPNDFAALHTLALRLFKERGEPLPATRGVSIINAGSGGSGGYAAVLKLAGSAREMGLRAIGIVDGDTDSAAQQHLRIYSSLPNAVVRLTDTVAIEAALVGGLPDEVLRQTIKEVADSADVSMPQSLDQLSGPMLADAATSFIKANSLHGPFIDALPETYLPTQVIQLLSKAVEAATGSVTGVVQL